MGAGSFIIKINLSFRATDLPIEYLYLISKKKKIFTWKFSNSFI